ncbi:TPA: hypothetical protein U1278_001954 [Streptococcus suis]|nr:hypothetical protein [Streptococcus suis]
MKFNNKVTKPNPNYDTQLQAKEEAMKLINEIDKYIDYATDVADYEAIKLKVQNYTPAERINYTLSESHQAELQSLFDKLQELATTLK